MMLADFSDPSQWMTEFSVTSYMFWSCVTLGFLKSAIASENKSRLTLDAD
jgi:hypothetical protein